MATTTAKVQVTQQDLIDALNGDLEEEYASAIQYINHAALITGARYLAVQKELLAHADEEMHHAKLLADQIAYFGAKPTVEIGPVQVAESAEEMLRQDLAGEESAVARYNARIRSAMEMGEFGVARILEDIVVMEREHVKDLQMALGL